MRLIQTLLYVGAGLLSAGLLALALWWVIGEPAGFGSILSYILFVLALSGISFGGFLCACAGMVLTVHALTEPRSQ